MKLSSKSISSPGRTEKFPPQLMRFWGTNVGSGSRSRGRSRSSPMFFRRKNAAAIETQEPSSPKVTCMGQVRVKRSTRQAATAGNGRPRVTGTRRRCKLLRNALFCHPLARKIKSPSCRPTWRKWVLFLQVGFLRKTEIRADSSGFEPKLGNDSELSEREDEDKEGDEKVVAEVFVSCPSPPKNALLLTRCRSAPYRSSSLASKFWGSPQTTEETEVTEQRTEQENTEEQSEGESTSDKESRIGPETVEKLRFFKEFEGGIRERFIKSINIEDVKTGKEADSIRPVILTRCKSEPTRTAEKTDTEINFQRKRRLGFAESR